MFCKNLTLRINNVESIPFHMLGEGTINMSLLKRETSRNHDYYISFDITDFISSDFRIHFFLNFVTSFLFWEILIKIILFICLLSSTFCFVLTILMAKLVISLVDKLNLRRSCKNLAWLIVFCKLVPIFIWWMASESLPSGRLSSTKSDCSWAIWVLFSILDNVVFSDYERLVVV